MLATVLVEKHECGFKSRPATPKLNDTLTLSCSVVVNGMWNASLIFRDEQDNSVVIGEPESCGTPPNLGSKLCSLVKVTANKDIFAYSCRLVFPPEGRHVPTNQVFQNSKWTAEFNREVACYLPQIYLEGT